MTEIEQIDSIEDPHARRLARLALSLRGTENWSRNAFPLIVCEIVDGYRRELADSGVFIGGLGI